MNNVEIAIMQMVNQLAIRCQVKPTDFQATLSQDESTLDWTLDFDWPAHESAMELKRRVLFINLGIRENECSLAARSLDSIYDAVEHALDSMPVKKPRVR